MATDQITKQLQAQSHVAYRYVVEVNGERMAAFTECVLPTIEWEVEEVREGGLNTYVHQLPGRRKAARLSLKHGVAKGLLFDWYIEALSKKFTPKNVTVRLLDILGQPVASWIMSDAYPIKWGGPQLRSDSNAIALMSLDFACGQVDFEVA